ncbi:MAG: Fe-S protein assembly co-chaperone HscB [Buchnera aphidicola (Tetraneura akinire)]
MKNYFKIFNLPVSFQLDKKKLTKNFYDLQKKYHPDFCIDEDQIKKSNLMNKSIKINHAYKILIDPIKRAEYYIRINYLNFEKEKKNIPFDINFLKKHMKLCEELEYIKKSSKKNEKTIRFFLKKIDDLIFSYLHKIEKKFINKEWIIAVIILNKLFFLKKIKHSAIQEISNFNK